MERGPSRDERAPPLLRPRAGSAERRSPARSLPDAPPYVSGLIVAQQIPWALMMTLHST